MKKKVWVVSFKQKDSNTYYPLIVVDNAGEIKSAINDWKQGMGVYWEGRGFDLNDVVSVQVMHYG